jgi:hypothetical protein
MQRGVHVFCEDHPERQYIATVLLVGTDSIMIIGAETHTLVVLDDSANAAEMWERYKLTCQADGCVRAVAVRRNTLHPVVEMLISHGVKDVTLRGLQSILLNT